MVLAFAVAVVAGSLIWVISRSVAGPIGTLTDTMALLAKRDWSVMVKGRSRKDEIGRMAGTLQVFKESGQSADQMQAEMEAERGRVAEEQRTEMLAFADRFEKAIGAVVQRVGNSAREMAGSVGATSRRRRAHQAALCLGRRRLARGRDQRADGGGRGRGADHDGAGDLAPGGRIAQCHHRSGRRRRPGRRRGQPAVGRGGAHRRRHQDDHRDRRADQPLGAQRYHRGGARRRCRQGLRGGGGGGQELGAADLARDRADHQPDFRDPGLDPDHGRRHPRRRRHHPQGQRDLAGGGGRDRAAGRRDPGDRP